MCVEGLQWTGACDVARHSAIPTKGQTESPSLNLQRLRIYLHLARRTLVTTGDDFFLGGLAATPSPQHILQACTLQALG